MIPRTKFQLRKGAVPCIFPNLPYLSKRSSSKPRLSPTKRCKKIKENHDLIQEEWIRKDQIPSFLDFCIEVEERNQRFQILCFFELSDDENSGPKIKFCIKVDNTLKVTAWNNGVKVLPKSLLWLNFSNERIFLWSQLENLVSRMISDVCALISDECLVAPANNIIDKISTEDNKDVRTLLKEQLQLSIRPPHQRRFSLSIMISSFALFLKSASFYETVPELIILPSCHWLRQISATVTANCDLESNEYLQRKTSYLQDEEIYVNLMLDEIHVKPQLSFKNSSLTGCDDDNNLATSIHCFMISSLRSKYKEVVKLVPAKTMDAEKLLTCLKSVLRSLVQAGYKVVSVITDGNRINKRLFCLLCGCDKVSDLPT